MLRNNKQNLVWGVLLVLFGVISLIELNLDVNIGTWGWVLILATAGLVILGIYLTDRSNVSILIISYSLFATALMIALIDLNWLQDEFIATYVLAVIAFPFILGFLRSGRTQWGLLIPAYVLLAVGIMVGLIGLGVLRNLLIPAYVMIAISLPFFAGYYRNRSNGGLLIPGGITAFIGISFLMVSAARFIGPIVLIALGAWILVRQLRPKETADG